MLGGGEVALVVDWLALKRSEVGEAAHADHEELVEVRLEDRGEVEALEKRNRLVVGLLEHAVVKAQPADLAVLRVREVIARRFVDNLGALAALPRAFIPLGDFRLSVLGGLCVLRRCHGCSVI